MVLNLIDYLKFSYYKGTTFEVYLPAIDQEEVIEVKEKSELGVELIGKGKKILIVEDADSVRDLLYRVMKRCGFEVRRAESIKVAKRLFKNEEGGFDIILPDQGLTGYDLALDLQQQNPDLKIILASGYADVKDRLPKIFDSEFPFLTKPFSIKELIQLLRKVLNS